MRGTAQHAPDGCQPSGTAISKNIRLLCRGVDDSKDFCVSVNGVNVVRDD